MFGRKVFTAFYTSFLLIAFLNILVPVPAEDGGLFTGVLVYSIYVVAIVYIYGILTSMIADQISLKAKTHKTRLSFGLHLLFGIMFIIPYSLFIEYDPIPEISIMNVLTYPITMLGLGSSALFFFIDRILLKRERLIKIRNS